MIFLAAGDGGMYVCIFLDFPEKNPAAGGTVTAARWEFWEGSMFTGIFGGSC